MKKIYFIVTILLLSFGCADVDEPVALEHFMVNETEKDGQLEFSLRWKVNGVADDGMVADVNIYLSPSKGIDSSEKDEALGNTHIVVSGYYGALTMIPSRKSLPDFYRYYIGVAFNGVILEDVTYPLAITYELVISQPNIESPLKVITGEFDIDNAADASKTFVDYQYRMDINDGPDTDAYRSYSIRQLENSIAESRVSDVVNTTTFPGENLNIDFHWKANGGKGFEKVDLDLYLHDIAKDDVNSSDDLEESSANEDAYERIATDGSKFSPGVIRKLGYYYFQNLEGSTPMEVEYMYKAYSFSNNKLRRFVKYGSFNVSNIQANNGNFYFDANLTWNSVTKEFKITPLASTLVWNP